MCLPEYAANERTPSFDALGRRSGALRGNIALEIAGLVLSYVSYSTRRDAMRAPPAHADLDSRSLPPVEGRD